jgi:hypothetical protein
VFVLEPAAVPLNPLMVFDYFLLDAVDRDLVRESNNILVKGCDEVWVFGPVSNGVLVEIRIANSHHKTVRYFAIRRPHTIAEVNMVDAEMEVKVAYLKSFL